MLRLGKYAAISSVYVKENSFKDYRFCAAKALEGLGYHVCRNPENCGTTQRSFEEFLREHKPIFILIVGEQSSEMVYRECKLALELGLHIFTFIKVNKTGKISPKTEKFIREISDTIYSYDCCCFDNGEKLFEEVKSRIEEYDKRRGSDEPIITLDIPDAYNYCARKIASARHRVILIQQTSSLILGAREGRDHEKKFVEATEKWLAKKSKSMQFHHYFSINATREAMGEDDNYDPNYPTEKFKPMFEKIIKDSNSSIRYIDKNDFGIISLLITDNDMVMAVNMGKRKIGILLPSTIMNSPNYGQIQQLFAEESKALNDVYLHLGI